MMGLPIDLPVKVSVLKKVYLIDKATGRSIEYKSESSLEDSNVVSFSGCYGSIEYLFLYRGIEFAFLRQFNAELLKRTYNGFVTIEDYTICTRAVYRLEDISRPLITALDPPPRLWIINV